MLEFCVYMHVYMYFSFLCDEAEWDLMSFKKGWKESGGMYLLQNVICTL